MTPGFEITDQTFWCLRLKGLAYNDWIFNAWGNKYEELKRDNGIPAILEQQLGVPRFQPGIVMEGGSIEVNGAGVVMTTEQCLLNPNRNPQLDRATIESYLRRLSRRARRALVG